MPRLIRRQITERMTPATADNAGAMRVSPGSRAGKSPAVSSPPVETTLTLGKQLSQGPTTGFGSFKRNTPLSMDVFHELPR